MVKIGDKAPLFALESYNSGMIDLSKEIGQQKIVLIFSRYFGCPICQVDLRHLLNRVGELREKGAKVIYITQSGKKIANDYIKSKNIDFPVVFSSKDELYDQYGLGIMNPEAVVQLKSKLKEAMELGIKHGEYEGWEKQGPLACCWVNL
ncbi:MAG: redoxin domain-containing protein [Candidatus Lokiarchaeota archaeon]